MRKSLSFLLCFLLIFEQSAFAQIAGQMDISGYFSGLRNQIVQDKFRPLHLRYLSYDNNSDIFKLMLDKGDRPEDLETGAKKLFDYFLIGLVLPNDSFWVNLRPDSPDNIMDAYLAKTDLGRVLLEADVQLKKDTAVATSPETQEGRKYWDLLYKKAGALFGQENITIPTLTRPWIVPGEIIVRESGSNAYIYKATLKVMLEQDYLKDSAGYSFNDPRLKELNEYASSLIREMILPKLILQVNSSKKYAALRQVYYSLILSQWFKSKFVSSKGKYASLINSRTLSGLTSQKAWDKQSYFKQYRDSFNNGEYNIKEKHSTAFGQVIRTYTSGGIAFADIPNNIQLNKISSSRVMAIEADYIQRAVVDANGNIRMETGEAAVVSSPLTAIDIREINYASDDFSNSELSLKIHNYGVGNIRSGNWGVSGDLLQTSGAANCVVSVLIDNEGKLGILGHYPYVISQVSDKNLNKGFYNYIEEIKKIIDPISAKYTLYLFGGSPMNNDMFALKEAQDNKNAIRNAFTEALGEHISDIVDKTASGFEDLDWLIADIKNKEITYHYNNQQQKIGQDKPSFVASSPVSDIKKVALAAALTVLPAQMIGQTLMPINNPLGQKEQVSPLVRTTLYKHYEEILAKDPFKELPVLLKNSTFTQNPLYEPLVRQAIETLLKDDPVAIIVNASLLESYPGFDSLVVEQFIRQAAEHASVSGILNTADRLKQYSWFAPILVKIAKAYPDKVVDDYKEAGSILLQVGSDSAISVLNNISQSSFSFETKSKLALLLDDLSSGALSIEQAVLIAKDTAKFLNRVSEINKRSGHLGAGSITKWITQYVAYGKVRTSEELANLIVPDRSNAYYYNIMSAFLSLTRDQTLSVETRLKALSTYKDNFITALSYMQFTAQENNQEVMEIVSQAIDLTVNPTATEAVSRKIEEEFRRAPQKILFYLSMPEVVKPLLEAHQYLQDQGINIDLSFFIGAAFAEGYLEYARAIIEGNIAAFSTTMPIGLDRFGSVQTELKERGLLPQSYDGFITNDQIIVNEGGAKYLYGTFRSPKDALIAHAALLLQDREKFLAAAKKMGAQTLSEDEINVGTYLYYCSGNAEQHLKNLGPHLVGKIGTGKHGDGRFNAQWPAATSKELKQLFNGTVISGAQQSTKTLLSPNASSPVERKDILKTLEQKIKQSGGKITFADFMQSALYDPDSGYYQQQVNISKNGDFDTFAENINFGSQMADQIIEMWSSFMQNHPSFEIVEMGAGTGALAKNILTYLKNDPQGQKLYNSADFKYTIVEISSRLKVVQAEKLAQFGDKVAWKELKELKEVNGVFISNELVDAFPVHIVRMQSGELKEIYITVKAGRLQEELGQVSDKKLEDYLADNDLVLPEGKEIAISLEAFAWQKNIGAALKKGFVITSDYGVARLSDVIEQPNVVWSANQDKIKNARVNIYQNINSGRAVDITWLINFADLIRDGRKQGLNDFSLFALRDSNFISTEDPAKFASISPDFRILMQEKGVFGVQTSSPILSGPFKVGNDEAFVSKITNSDAMEESLQKWFSQNENRFFSRARWEAEVEAINAGKGFMVKLETVSGTIVGLSIYVRKPFPFADGSAKDVYYADYIEIDKNYQRQGLAEILMAKAVEIMLQGYIAPDIKTLIVSHPREGEGVEDVIKFHNDLGFSVMDYTNREEVFSDEDDQQRALWMGLSIDGARELLRHQQQVIKSPSSFSIPNAQSISLPALSRTDKTGGIDFRGLPIITQPMANAPAFNRQTITGGMAPVANINLNQEWVNIQSMLKAGIIPSSDRIKEYARTGSQAKDAQKELTRVISCIADILRSQEENLAIADTQLKAILILLESGKQNNELLFGLSSIACPSQPL